MNKCESCGHSLVDNKHGIDQNDFDILDGEYVYSGSCTYCKICRGEHMEQNAMTQDEKYKAARDLYEDDELRYHGPAIPLKMNWKALAEDLQLQLAASRQRELAGSLRRRSGDNGMTALRFILAWAIFVAVFIRAIHCSHWR